MKLVSIVIPAVRNSKELLNCLESLRSQKDIESEVLVVFNPVIPVGFVKEKFANLKALQSGQGVNRARNVGARASRHPWILFLDSDCELQDPYHISKLLDALEGRPNSSGVGGLYCLHRESSSAAKAYNAIQMNWLLNQVANRDYETESLIGGHMLLKRDVVLSLLFDEKIIFGGSEREFFVRAKQAGHQFYLRPELTVMHKSDLSESELVAKARLQGRGEFYIRKKHRSPSARAIKGHFEGLGKLEMGLVNRYFKEFHAQVHKRWGIGFRNFVSLSLEHLQISFNRKNQSKKA